MTDLPSGLLTFVFTDIEGSTSRWESGPDEMRRVLHRHDEILGQAISAGSGLIFKHTGDGVGAVFTSPQRAAAAAIEVQREIQKADWGPEGRLRVRIGIHVGEAEPERGDYYGPTVNRAARIMDVANGAQIATSRVVTELVSGFDIRPAGEHQLRGIGTERVFLLTADGLEQDPRPLRARVGSSAAQLPSPPHGIIGRDDEVATVRSLLADHRAVTVVGSGGVGKSRLVIEVGRSMQEGFGDGVVMCELAPVGDDDSVADAVAEALGARIQPGLDLEDSIANYLRHRDLLLVLDGCEHVIDSVRELVRRILAVDGPVVLATSREPIGLSGEQLYGLTPLDPATFGAALFAERAAERDAHFAARPGDDHLIREICAKVDGVPLAIELAAAWVRVLSLTQLSEQLEDRFRILRGGQHHGRQETLRDTIRWSYEQLDEREGQLFSRLSVFAGSFSLDAVEEVCSADLGSSLDLLDLVMALVDKSMVVTERGVGHIRFRMLGTLRQFGQEQLDAGGERDAVRHRHAAYFSDFAAAQAAAMFSAREPEVWDLLGRDWANIRSALETMLDDDDIDAAADLVVSLAWFAGFSMRFEALAWASELWPRIDDDHPRAGALLGMRALEAYFTADGDSVLLANRGLELDEVDAEGLCRATLAAVYLNNVHSAQDSAALTESWLKHSGEGGPANRLWAEGFRTFHLCVHDPTPEAADHVDALLALAATNGSATTMTIARWAQGLVTAISDRDRAMASWDQGLDAARSLNARHLGVHLLVGLQLHFAASHGELESTLQRCRDALQTALDQHYLAGTSHLFGVTAIVLSRADHAETGARLLGAMQANGHLPRANALRAINQAFGPETDRHLAEGGGMSIDDAAGLAIATLDRAIAETRT
jgi:predicted ATPase/class 3 adenylate cyclase